MMFHHPSFQIFIFIYNQRPLVAVETFFYFLRKWNLFWLCFPWPGTPTSKTLGVLEGAALFPHPSSPPLSPTLPHNKQAQSLSSSVFFGHVYMILSPKHN